MRNILRLFLVFLFPVLASGQSLISFSGKITDAQLKPLQGVTVVEKTTHKKTVTDSAGTFTLQLSPGSYTILFSHVGFKKEEKSIKVVAGQSTAISISLKHEQQELDGVQVTGKSAIEKVRETPFNVVALDAKSQYNSTMSMTDLLARASGVKIREAGGVGSDANISINGFTGRNIKIFIDGVPMQGAASSFQLNNIPVSLAERIEVYKGVVPIEFGADAIGGVINIVTNRSANSFLDASYSYGSFNTHRTNVTLGHTTKKGFSFQINAYQNYSDNSFRIKSRLLNNGQYSRDTSWFNRFHGGYHNEAVVAKIGVVNKRWADRFFIGATLSQDYKEIQNAPANVEFVYGDVFTKRSGIQPTLEYYKRSLFTKGLTVRVSGNYNYNKNSTVDTSSYKYNWMGNRVMALTKGERGITSLSDFFNSNYAATANANYNINEHHSVIVNNVNTGSVRRLTSTAPEDIVTEFQKLRRLSMKNVLGLSYRYTQGNKWNVNVFGKNYSQRVKGPFNAGDEGHEDWQQRDASYSTIGYGFAATYFLKDFQFKTSAERAYRLPTDNELFGDEVEEQGNASLKAENSMNYNLGFTLNKTYNNRNVLYLDVNGYYRDTKDFIRREILVRTGTLTSVNFGNVKTYGVDAEARFYYKDKAMIGGTITYMDIRDKEKFRESNGTATNGHYNDRMPNMPYLFGGADAAYYWHGLFGKKNVLNLNYRLNYVNAFFLNWESLGISGNKYTLPNQLSHDFSATYTMKSGMYNITFEVQNLLNAELSDNFGMLKPGRAFYGKFRYYFMHRNKKSS